MERYKSIYIEQALVDKDDFFSKHKKDIKSDKDTPYWERPGWEEFRKYIKEVRKTYLKQAGEKTYSEWFKLEIKGLKQKTWAKLPENIQKAMIKFFKDLDENPSILDKKYKNKG